MSEAKVINKTPMLRTRESLKRDFVQLGLYEGMTVIVHSALSSLGWVCGGPITVIQALMDVITPSGTIIMPAHSGDLSEPRYWESPPVPKEWWQIIRDTMPAFEREITPTRGMGAIAEAFRSFPGVIRSDHPTLSFCAWGKHGEWITKDQSLEFSMGERSPLARIYDLDGWVLLLGVGYENNTSFHLAEYRAPGKQLFKTGSPIIENGQRIWKTYQDIEFDSDIFSDIGFDFEKEEEIMIGNIGSAEAKFFKQREAVDFAQKWLKENRKKK